MFFLAAENYKFLTMVLLVPFLAFACWTDWKSSRIPNLLTLAMAVTGILAHSLVFGLAGAGSALAGMGVGLLVFLPAYLIWGIGGGDVKLVAAAGSFLGPYKVLVACILIMIAGGALALAVLVIRGGVLSFLRRYGLMLRALVTTGQFYYVPARQGEAASARFPYAFAVALGTLAAVWWLDF